MNKTFIAILVAILPAWVLAADPTTCSIIPLPQKVEASAGTFKLTKDAQIQADADSRGAGKLLADRLAASTGYPLQVVDETIAKPPQGSIILAVDPSLQGGAHEAYDLAVDADSVVIRGSDAAGVFYGTQSLLQLFPPEVFSSKLRTNIKWIVPCQHIEDQPRFKWRGMLLDVSRHFFTVEQVKRVLDLMALHKLNVFQWHLVDDDGWRLEIKKYPRLTSEGAWRAEIGFYQDPRWSTAYGPDGRYGGFYTQDEIRDVVAYAQARHITIVPEIEMPGHCGAAIRAYPELLCTTDDGKPPRVRNVLCVNEQSIAFEENVLTEVFKLFPGKYIHIGGDEVNTSNWQHCPECQALMKAQGLHNEHELESYFLRQIDKFINEHGRILVGWSEMRLGGIPPSAVLMDWKGGGAESASEGYDVVMTPPLFSYFDLYQSLDQTIAPRALGGYVPLWRVYSFEPVPDNLDPKFDNHILGSQANLWSELISSQKQLDFMTYPRLCALSEVLWSPKESRNWDSFQKRLAMHYRRLDQLGVNYFEDRSVKVGEWEPTQIKSESTTLEWDVTKNIGESGKYHAQFEHHTGAGINIAWVALLENGKEIARDTHPGCARDDHRMVGSYDALYILTAPGRKPGAKYMLQASVTPEDGTDSAGEVKFEGPMRRPLW